MKRFELVRVALVGGVGDASGQFWHNGFNFEQRVVRIVGVAAASTDYAIIDVYCRFPPKFGCTHWNFVQSFASSSCLGAFGFICVKFRGVLPPASAGGSCGATAISNLPPLTSHLPNPPTRFPLAFHLLCAKR